MDSLLRLYCLMEAIAPSSTRLHTAGKLIDNNHLPIAHHVLFVALVERLGAYGSLKVVNKFDTRIAIDILDPERFLRLFDTRIGERYLFVLSVGSVVFFQREGTCNRRETAVERFGFRHWRGNNQGRPCFIDKDGIDLVDDGEMVATMCREPLP